VVIISVVIISYYYHRKLHGDCKAVHIIFDSEQFDESCKEERTERQGGWVICGLVYRGTCTERTGNIKHYDARAF